MSRQLFEKECPICGTVFQSTCKTAKYCEDHRKNGARTLAKIERKQESQRAERIRNKIVTYNCERCGKQHSVPQYLLSKLAIGRGAKGGWGDRAHLYCCTSHMEQDRHDHQRCDNCGKLLLNSTYYYNMYSKYNFCSFECEEEHKKKRADVLMNTFTCQHCGKQFKRKADEAYFCSQDCSVAARKAGWKSPKTIERERIEEQSKVTLKVKCSICGKEFNKTYRNGAEAAILSHGSIFFCSKECSALYREQMKQKVQKKRSANSASKSKKGCDTQLCATCKTSYKDCERMQSNFRILPKGAHYNNKGIITTCPKYK